MSTYDTIIIGGGPAGITAATEAARIGVSVALIDENENLGGKVFGPTGNAIKGSASDKIEKDIGSQILKGFNRVRDKISVFLNTEVWDIVDQRIVSLYPRDGSDKQIKGIKGEKLIISIGAFEKAIPFPGWTLPGVFSVGGLNTLVKKKILPGERFLLAGAGPLQTRTPKCPVAFCDHVWIDPAGPDRGVGHNRIHLFLARYGENGL